VFIMSAADDVLSQWMQEELRREPTRATSLGLDGYDHLLGDFSEGRWVGRAQDDRRTAGALAALPLAELPVDEQVDVTLVLAELAGRQVLDGWEGWRREPAWYVDPCLGGIHSLWLHRLHPDAELADASLARLAEIPDVVAHARANLSRELMPALFARRGAARAAAGARYLRDQLPGESDDAQLSARIAEAAVAPAEALADLAAYLADAEAGCRGDWALGEERYSALLGERELLGPDLDAAGLHAQGQHLYRELSAEMDQVARRIDPAATGWAEVLARLSEDCPSTPEEMRAAYAASCDSARAFLVEHELVSFSEGERCLVVPSPLFQRPVLAVASYQAPPPFSTSTTGHFFVPYPPEDETPDGLHQRMADNGYHAIPTTAVHEAYPGHHWQLTWSAATPRPVRKMVRTSYFVEGWALYAERMMYEQGYFTDPRQVLCHLAARLFRAARVVVDTALHTKEMSAEEAVGFMSERAGLTGTVARAEVERYCSWPTQAASYLTGAVQIEALRDRWLAEGRGDLRAFHDAVAANPGLPVALAGLLLFPHAAG